MRLHPAFGAWVVLAAAVWIAPAAGGDFSGLQAAVRGAKPGQSVVVPPGIYRGQLVVDVPVLLRGEPGARLVHAPGEGGPTLWIRAAGARVESLTIEGSGEGTRRDHTAVVVSAPGVELRGLTVNRAWAGLWIEGADHAVVDGFRFRGLDDFPFWERGDAVRVTSSAGTRLDRLDVAFCADGVSLEKDRDTALASVTVSEARYGIHLMFSQGGSVTGATTRHAVVGLMAMESSAWSVRASTFTEGYRTGSAGVRQVRTKGLLVQNCRISRQAAGIELLDAREGVFIRNRIEENAVAWTWGGDNTDTVAGGNTHRGNLADVSGAEPREADLVPRDAHNHGAPATPAPARVSGPVKPVFLGNWWDAWHGWDLDGDGLGDTPYRYDPAESTRKAASPWAGLFLGSPWSVVSQTLPGGIVLDEWPLTEPDLRP